MTRMGRSRCRKLITLLAAVVMSSSTVTIRATAAAGATVGLAPHRAVYDLKLARTRGKRVIEAIRGRILYDFSGNACDGYALQFRQVSELDSGEGKRALSDLRAATWEDGAARTFRFNSQNFIDQRASDAVDGRAEREKNRIAVNLTKPKEKSFELAAGMVFPTEHMRLIIEAARAGTTLVERPVYDGSETGEKVYNTLTVIGHEIAPDQRVPADAAAGKGALSGLKRWPVTISYFDRASKEGEPTPVYSIAFELYENGISRALTLDYGDFVVSGEMSQLDIKDTAACK